MPIPAELLRVIGDIRAEMQTKADHIAEYATLLEEVSDLHRDVLTDDEAEEISEALMFLNAAAYNANEAHDAMRSIE